MQKISAVWKSRKTPRSAHSEAEQALRPRQFTEGSIRIFLPRVCLNARWNQVTRIERHCSVFNDAAVTMLAHLLYLLWPQLTFGSSQASLPSGRYYEDNYGTLQEIINSNASLSPNEATRIGSSADGDVVRLIAALPRVSHATAKRFNDSDYDYMPRHVFLKTTGFFLRSECLSCFPPFFTN